jgi:hypothetical protein
MVKVLHGCCVLAVFALISGTAWGQLRPTTVQLPTFSMFGVDTTVSVPDGGSAYLGGVDRASSGGNQFGGPMAPFGNRSIGSQQSASSMRVSAYIHDFQAMDEQLLNQPTAFNRGLTPPQTQVARAIGQRVNSAQAAPAGQPAADVAGLRAQRLQEEQARSQESAGLLDRGQAAEAAGKLSVARLYYQMAYRKAEGDAKVQALGRLQALSQTKASALAETGR